MDTYLLRRATSLFAAVDELTQTTLDTILRISRIHTHLFRVGLSLYSNGDCSSSLLAFKSIFDLLFDTLSEDALDL
jgi:hypothetical protein